MRVEDPVLLQRHRVALVLGVGELNLIPGLKRPMPAKTHARKGIGARAVAGSGPWPAGPAGGADWPPSAAT
ncbi:hypothetical protein Ppa06_23550 [Planomonospora parontospora subsp. parontospora]|uniref:Uncharacterized protein n=2 Tax=Planomonospora parontospora TaxID=58119 RepID=A0AA37F4J6_9ACTN|nr:hypothetical protein GCM10010126_27960 [Planomonospora parontospora]GII08557.1 hypothetical protein Ppa06_23550 [Planomonospora parontospora subsp. parontospora]